MTKTVLLKKTDHTERRLTEMLATALGPKIAGLLEDPDIIEIMLNPDGRLWIDRLREGRSYTGHTVPAEDAARIIYLVASSTETACNHQHPIVSAEFPGTGNRFQGLMPPVVSAPAFTIRKKALMVFTLEDYISQGIMTKTQKDAIQKAVRDKQNILVAGGTGSGKTTLVNAILNEIAKTGDRVVIIEDTLELQCAAPDTVFLRSRDHVSMNDLLKATMRLRPDRIVIGEVRGPEALTLCKAWATGHPGGAGTVHASSARGSLTRLEQLIQEASPSPQRELIAETINLIIYIERCQTGRRIREIAAVEGLENNRYILKPV